MTRLASVTGLLARAGRCPLWVLALLGAALLVLAGCSNPAQKRAKAADDAEVTRYDVATVGDRTTVSNAEPIALGGVGLVEGLEGTGGDCTHDNYRAMLVTDLSKDHVKNPSGLLKDPSCALVIVEAMMPPGAGKDDKIDVVVKLPPGSKATSLRGGVLRRCALYNYDFAKNLRPDYQGGDKMMIGHKLALAGGPVLVGTGDGDEAAKVKAGKVWAGGRLTTDNPLALIMNPDSQQGRFTSLIADRVNGSFQSSGLRGALDSRLAYTKDNITIALRVPAQYRFNVERYLRVVRMIPLTDSADSLGKTEADKRSYRQKLGDDLLDPARTVVAALRLEALGTKSVPILKEKGLTSPHAIVRFCSAESLAYLGSPSAGEELGKATVESPMLRAFALTALASLDESISHMKLREMVVSNLDEETRYGAFRALRLLNENDPLVQGELLNDNFWLHRLARGTKSFVHVCTTRRAEIALFGTTAELQPPFSFLAGEFAITSGQDDTRCTVSRFPLRGEPMRKQCSLQLEAVLRTMAELGGQYPEVITLLQQAAACESLSCRVRVDALPQAVSVQELAKAGREGGDVSPAATQELGKTPTLFQLGVPTAGDPK